MRPRRATARRGGSGTVILLIPPPLRLEVALLASNDWKASFDVARAFLDRASQAIGDALAMARSAQVPPEVATGSGGDLYRQRLTRLRDALDGMSTVEAGAWPFLVSYGENRKAVRERAVDLQSRIDSYQLRLNGLSTARDMQIMHEERVSLEAQAQTLLQDSSRAQQELDRALAGFQGLLTRLQLALSPRNPLDPSPVVPPEEIPPNPLDPPPWVRPRLDLVSAPPGFRPGSRP